VNFPDNALNTDANQKLTSAVYDTDVAAWMQKNQNYVQSSGGVWVPLTLDANGNQKTSVKDSALPAGAATQTTLADILAKIIAAPATEAKQDTLNAKDFATQTTLAAILAKIIAAPATEAKQDALIAKDFATQTTLAAILAKLTADPATQTTLAAILTQLGTTGLKKIIDALPPGDNNIGNVDIVTNVLPAGSGTLTANGNLTLSGAAQNLTNTPCKSLLLQAHPLNTGYVYGGSSNAVSSTVHIFILTPGSCIPVNCSNANLLWVIGTTGDKVSYGGEV